MNTISVTKLKTNPAKAINDAVDLPVAIKKRDKIEAYLIGKDLYKKLISYIENYMDSATVKDTDFSKGRDFDKVVEELGI